MRERSPQGKDFENWHPEGDIPEAKRRKLGRLPEAAAAALMFLVPSQEAWAQWNKKIEKMNEKQIVERIEDSIKDTRKAASKLTDFMREASDVAQRGDSWRNAFRNVKEGGVELKFDGLESDGIGAMDILYEGNAGIPGKAEAVFLGTPDGRGYFGDTDNDGRLDRYAFIESAAFKVPIEASPVDAERERVRRMMLSRAAREAEEKADKADPERRFRTASPAEIRAKQLEVGRDVIISGGVLGADIPFEGEVCQINVGEIGCVRFSSGELRKSSGKEALKATLLAQERYEELLKAQYKNVKNFRPDNARNFRR